MFVSWPKRVNKLLKFFNVIKKIAEGLESVSFPPFFSHAALHAATEHAL